MNRFLPLTILSLFLLMACDDAFIHDIPTRRQPNDLASCAPDAGVEQMSVSLVEDWVRLSWETSATTHEGFLIERRAHDSLAWGEVDRAPVAASEYDDFGAQPNRRYVYRISTFRTSGAGLCESLPSEEVPVTTIPAAADRIDVEVTGAGALLLSWSDSNEFLTGYRIERQIDGEGFLWLAELPATTRSYLDDSVDLGAIIDYRLSVINDSGSSASTAVRFQVSSRPTLQWVGLPSLDDTCTLANPGEVTLAGVATGIVDSSGTIASATGSTDATGDATGIRGPLPDLNPGSLNITWTVVDNAGGQTTIGRDLELSTQTVTRSVERLPRGTRGDDASEGRQALRPGCSQCSGNRGQISAGGLNSCLLTDAGAVLCWGKNSRGSTGRGRIDLGSIPYQVETPVDVCKGTPGDPCGEPLTAIDLAVSAVSYDGPHSCARTGSGETWCWGYNGHGQLGDGTSTDRGVPTRVCATGSGSTCEPLLSVRELSLGEYFSCARLLAGEVRCWGYGYYGRLGDGVTGSADQQNPVGVCAQGTWLGTTQTCNGGALLTGTLGITAGGAHACAIRADKTAVCWGYNGYGRLGDGTTDNSGNPVPVGGAGTELGNIEQLAVGLDHSCALLGDGTVFCWGHGASGQLGNGTNTSTNSLPTQVCTSGSAGSCVPLESIAQITAGNDFTCAVNDSGEAFCWGYPWDGRLGNGNTSDSQFWPQPVCTSGQGASCAPLTGVRHIDAGRAGACAVLLNGESVCWGDVFGGQVPGVSSDESDRQHASINCESGSGSTCQVMVDAVLVRTSASHGCALFEETGRVACWGKAWEGQVGIGSVWRQHEPLPVCTNRPGISCDPLAGVTALALGPLHGCALKEDGSVWCWGINWNGELGIGNNDNDGIARPVCLSGTGSTCEQLTGVVAIAAGGNRTDYVSSAGFPTDSLPIYGHTCALMQDSRITCWGHNGYGQLGNGSQTPVGGSCTEDSDCTSNRCDGSQCVIWGSGLTLPVDVSCGVPSANCAAGDPLIGAVDLAAGYKHSCALMQDGSVKCWGDNSFGQLGDASTLGKLQPVDALVSDGVSIVAGANHTCAQLRNGTARCWGSRTAGQVGDGQVGGQQPTPSLVCATGTGGTCEPLTGITAMATSSWSTCALLADGTLRCWGSNYEGQLGDGTAHNRESPVSVCAPLVGAIPECDIGLDFDCSDDELLEGVVAITGGTEHFCALLDDGTATCWGRSFDGALGTATGDAVRWCRPTPGVCRPGGGPCTEGGRLADATIQSCDVVTVSLP